MASSIKSQNLLIPEARFNNFFFLFLLIFQAIALTIYFQFGIIYSLPIFLILIFLSFIILGKNRLKILLLFTIFFASLLRQPTPRKLTYLRLEEFPFFLLIFLTLLAFERKERYHLETKSDYLLLSFLLLTFFSLFYGIFLGNPILKAVGDFLVLFYYAFYFLVLVYFQEEKWQKVLIISIIIISILVSLQYVIPFLSTFQIRRYATDQQHLFNIGYPLLFSYIIFGKKTKYKILASLSLISMTLAIILSLTRSLWITIPFSLFIILVIYFWKQKSLKQIFGSIFLFLVIIFVVHILFKRGLDLKRSLKLRGVAPGEIQTDLSLLERIFSAQYIMKQFQKNPILGVGLGSTHPPVVPWKKGLEFSWMDCLFMNLLWKFGIVGFFLFFAIYFYFFKNIIKILKNSKDNFRQWVAAGVLSTFISLMIISIISGVLLIYRFNFIWASFLAIFNLWARKI